MRKKNAFRMFSKMAAAFLALAVILTVGLSSVSAGEIVWESTETGYRIIINDEAGLLSDEEIDKLADDMAPILAYGNAAFVTTAENYLTPQEYSETLSYGYFMNDSSVLFLIDMDNRMLILNTTGEIFRTVDKAYCDSITDNVYAIASEGRYYDCAAEVFSQVGAVLGGQSIARPMKTVSNLFLAMVLAVLLIFGIVLLIARRHRPSKSMQIKYADGNVEITDVTVTYSHTESDYSPIFTGGGGGGSSGGGFGGGSSGGGGGFSGGTGGHSF
ncbi:MAG: TPM domain-containing protein [Eubacterium sp.]|nr:TPM domain-containing protein [Eubacterium sp.]